MGNSQLTTISEKIDERWLETTASNLFDSNFLENQTSDVPQLENQTASSISEPLSLSMADVLKASAKELADLYSESESNPLITDLNEIVRCLLPPTEDLASDPQWIVRKRVLLFAQQAIVQKIAAIRAQDSPVAEAKVQFPFRWTKNTARTLLEPPSLDTLISASSMTSSITTAIDLQRIQTLTNVFDDALNIFACSLPLVSPLSLIKQQIAEGKFKKLVFEPITYESAHPYADNTDSYEVFEVPEAKSYTITFDPQTSTEQTYDFLKFYKDDARNAYWGEEKYSGGRASSAKNFPGFGGRSSLIIPASRFVVHFHSDGSNNDWGFKMTIQPSHLVVDTPLDKRLSHPFPSPETWSVDDSNQELVFSDNNTSAFRPGGVSSYPVAFARLPSARSSLAVKLTKAPKEVNVVTFGLSKAGLASAGSGGVGLSESIDSWGLCESRDSTDNAFFASCSKKMSELSRKLKEGDILRCVCDLTEGWAEISVNFDEAVCRFDIPEGHPSDYFFAASIANNHQLTIQPNKLDGSGYHVSVFASTPLNSPLAIAIDKMENRVQAHLLSRLNGVDVSASPSTTTTTTITTTTTPTRTTTTTTTTSLDEDLPTLNSSELSFLFSLSVLRNSLLGILSVVNILLTSPHSSGFSLGLSALPYYCFLVGDMSMKKEAFLALTPKELAVDILSSLETLSLGGYYPLSRQEDVERVFDMIDQFKAASLRTPKSRLHASLSSAS